MTHPKQDNALLEIFQEANEAGEDGLQAIVEHKTKK